MADVPLDGQWFNVPLVGKTNQNIVDDVGVMDVIKFSYAGGKIGTGHDKIPQLLVFGGPTTKLTADKRIPDKIEGVNLHYLDESKATMLFRWMKTVFFMRHTDPKAVVDMMMERYPFVEGVYRRYFVEKMTIRQHDSLESYANVRDEAHVDESELKKPNKKNDLMSRKKFIDKPFAV